MGAKGMKVGIPLAVGISSSSKLHPGQPGGNLRKGPRGGKRGAYIRLMGTKGMETGVPLAVGMGGSPLHPSHEVGQALQPCPPGIICHMQPCLQTTPRVFSSRLGFPAAAD